MSSQGVVWVGSPGYDMSRRTSRRPRIFLCWIWHPLRRVFFCEGNLRSPNSDNSDNSGRSPRGPSTCREILREHSEVPTRKSTYYIHTSLHCCVISHHPLSCNALFRMPRRVSKRSSEFRRDWSQRNDLLVLLKAACSRLQSELEFGVRSDGDGVMEMEKENKLSPDRQAPMPPHPEIVDGEPEYELETILDSQIYWHKLQYLVSEYSRAGPQRARSTIIVFVLDFNKHVKNYKQCNGSK
jgi:hypothetical protein